MSIDRRLSVVHDEGPGVDRRRFLSRCTGCALAGSCLLSDRGVSALGKPMEVERRPKVRLVFTHIPAGQPTWPYISYDYETRKRELTRQLVQGCPEVEFLPVTVHSADAARRLLTEDKDKAITGYLVSMVGIWTGAPQTIAEAGKPTLFVDDLYSGSGEFLVAFAAARRAGRNVAGVSSSRPADMLTAARCFAGIKDAGSAARFAADCMAAVRKTYKPMGDETIAAIDAPPKVDVPAAVKQLRESTILLVGRPMQPIEPVITQTLGTKIVPIDFKRLDEAYRKADQAQASEFAERWMREASAVVEPSADEIHRSAAMYVGMRDLMKQHNARAITINCLGGFYGGHMAAYPCLGFSQLNNDGFIGACEADMKSTLTMLAMSYLVGRAGYISDPVIDTSKNQIIYAHCVAMTKVDGPTGHGEPLPDPQPFRGPQRRLDEVAAAAGSDDDHGPGRSGPQGNTPAPGQVGGKHRRRPRLPHQTGRRSEGRYRQAPALLGPVGLAPGHLLRRPRTAGASPGGEPGLQVNQGGLTPRRERAKARLHEPPGVGRPPQSLGTENDWTAADPWPSCGLGR